MAYRLDLTGADGDQCHGIEKRKKKIEYNAKMIVFGNKRTKE